MYDVQMMELVALSSYSCSRYSWALLGSIDASVVILFLDILKPSTAHRYFVSRSLRVHAYIIHSRATLHEAHTHDIHHRAVQDISIQCTRCRYNFILCILQVCTILYMYIHVHRTMYYVRGK